MKTWSVGRGASSVLLAVLWAVAARGQPFPQIGSFGLPPQGKTIYVDTSGSPGASGNNIGAAVSTVAALQGKAYFGTSTNTMVTLRFSAGYYYVPTNSPLILSNNVLDLRSGATLWDADTNWASGVPTTPSVVRCDGPAVILGGVIAANSTNAIDGPIGVTYNTANYVRIWDVTTYGFSDGVYSLDTSWTAPLDFAIFNCCLNSAWDGIQFAGLAQNYLNQTDTTTNSSFVIVGNRINANCSLANLPRSVGAQLAALGNAAHGIVLGAGSSYIAQNSITARNGNTECIGVEFYNNRLKSMYLAANHYDLGSTNSGATLISPVYTIDTNVQSSAVGTNTLVGPMEVYGVVPDTNLVVVAFAGETGSSGPRATYKYDSNLGSRFTNVLSSQYAITNGANGWHISKISGVGSKSYYTNSTLISTGWSVDAGAAPGPITYYGAKAQQVAKIDGNGGLKTLRSNKLAPQLLQLTSSPATWVNTNDYNVVIVSEDGGVTSGTLSVNGETAFSIALDNTTISLQPGESATWTFVGNPTLHIKPQ